jgi:hypothetical protein
VSFGGTPEQYVGDINFVQQSLDTQYSQWWTMRFHGCLLNGQEISSGKGVYAIADTGTSLLSMVQSDYDKFVQYVQAASPDFKCDTLLNDYCYSNTKTCDSYWSLLPNMTIILDRNEYTIVPEGYTLSNSLGHPCVVAVQPTTDVSGMYVLGDTFLRNFLAKFDFKQKTVSFSVNSLSPAGTMAVAHMSTFVLTWIIVGSVVFVGLLAGAFIWARKVKAKKALEQQRSDNPLLSLV